MVLLRDDKTQHGKRAGSKPQFEIFHERGVDRVVDYQRQKQKNHNFHEGAVQRDETLTEILLPTAIDQNGIH
jgi:hypothetical protein